MPSARTRYPLKRPQFPRMGEPITFEAGPGLSQVRPASQTKSQSQSQSRPPVAGRQSQSRLPVAGRQSPRRVAGRQWPSAGRQLPVARRQLPEPGPIASHRPPEPSASRQSPRQVANRQSPSPSASRQLLFASRRSQCQSPVASRQSKGQSPITSRQSQLPVARRQLPTQRVGPRPLSSSAGSIFQPAGPAAPLSQGHNAIAGLRRHNAHPSPKSKAMARSHYVANATTKATPGRGHVFAQQR